MSCLTLKADPCGHKKTVSENRNGSRAKTEKTIETTKGDDRLVLSQNGLQQRSALHQVMIGANHAAKLRQIYARQWFRNINFLFLPKPKNLWPPKSGELINSGPIPDRSRWSIFFYRWRTRCVAGRGCRNFGSLFRYRPADCRKIPGPQRPARRLRALSAITVPVLGPESYTKAGQLNPGSCSYMRNQYRPCAGRVVYLHSLFLLSYVVPLVWLAGRCPARPPRCPRPAP